MWEAASDFLLRVAGHQGSIECRTRNRAGRWRTAVAVGEVDSESGVGGLELCEDSRKDDRVLPSLTA